MKHMIENPGVYRKLWMAITAGLLSIINGIVGLNVDDDVYSKGVEEVFNLVILLIGAYAVYKAKNDA